MTSAFHKFLVAIFAFGLIPGVVVCSQAFAYTEETHDVTTSDGKRLTLTRFKPDVINPKLEPVLFGHGIASNRHNFHLPSISMPLYFVNLGYDCWMIEFRGSGRSEKPPLLNPWGYDWGVDEYIRYDTPAVVDFVLQHTGQQDVFYIAHSMGGMVLYAYLETANAPKIKGGITLGSPGKFGGSGFVLQFLALFEPVINIAPVIYADAITAVLVPVSGIGDTPLGSTLWNYQNIGTQAIREMADLSVDNISTTVVKDFLRWENNDSFDSRDGVSDYKAGLGRVSNPMLIIAGEADQLGYRPNVRYAFDNISSPDKTFYNFSQANGYAADYGHLDLIFGDNAPSEVWPVIAEWLRIRDGDNVVNSVINTPRSNAVLQDLNVAFSGSANDRDGAGISLVEISTDGGTTFTPIANPGFTWTAVWKAPGPGTYEVVSRATDNYGNVQERFFPKTITIELPSPTPTPSPSPTSSPTATRTPSPMPTFTVVPTPATPRSLLAGYMASYISTGQGGKVMLMAISPEFSPKAFSLYFDDIDSGFRLLDDGNGADASPGDGAYTWIFDLPGGIPPFSILFDLRLPEVTDSPVWPYLVVQ